MGWVLVLGSWCLGDRVEGRSAEVAPASPPGGSGVAAKSAGLRFSVPRGFHREPFELVLEAGTGAGEIRYTLDGSVPGPRPGNVYRKAIPIGRTTVVRAAPVRPEGKTSRPRTPTHPFPAAIVRQSADGLPPAGWPYAWGAEVVDHGTEPAVVEDPKCPDAIRPALRSLPSYSPVTDSDDPFDERRGIDSNSGWRLAGSKRIAVSIGGRVGWSESFAWLHGREGR